MASSSSSSVFGTQKSASEFQISFFWPLRTKIRLRFFSLFRFFFHAVFAKNMAHSAENQSLRELQLFQMNLAIRQSKPCRISNDEGCTYFGDCLNQNVGECSICMNSLKAGIQLPCGHRFHSRCIEQWWEVARNCPLCRKPCESQQPCCFAKEEEDRSSDEENEYF